MAIISSNPIERDGNTYDRLAVNLAMSPLRQPDRFGLSIAVRLTPYRPTPDGPECLDDEVKNVVYGDANQEAANDPVLLEFLQALEAAGQAFVTAKGL